MLPKDRVGQPTVEERIGEILAAVRKGRGSGAVASQGFEVTAAKLFETRDVTWVELPTPLTLTSASPLLRKTTEVSGLLVSSEQAYLETGRIEVGAQIGAVGEGDGVRNLTGSEYIGGGFYNFADVEMEWQGSFLPRLDRKAIVHLTLALPKAPTTFPIMQVRSFQLGDVALIYAYAAVSLRTAQGQPPTANAYEEFVNLSIAGPNEPVVGRAYQPGTFTLSLDAGRGAELIVVTAHIGVVSYLSQPILSGYAGIDFHGIGDQGGPTPVQGPALKASASVGFTESLEIGTNAEPR